MGRKLIQFGTDLLKSTGINTRKDDDDGNIWRFIIPFGFTFNAILSCSIISISNIYDFYEFVVPIPYIAGVAIILIGSYSLYHHREVIGEIFREMDRNLYTYPDECSLQIEYEWYLQEENTTLVMTVLKVAHFSSVFMISVPMFGELVFCDSVKTFISPQWNPLKSDNFAIDLFLCLLQLCESLCGVWLNYTVMVFLGIVIIEFLRQYYRLMAAVGSLELRSLPQTGQRGGFDGRLRENIVHCIRHHQILIKNFHLFEIWFSVFFSLELAISAITFTFAIYIAMNARSLSQILNYFTVVLFIWMNLLIRCLISEVFSHLNNKLAETIHWETPWYNTSPENRKLLLMFHSIASQPLCLFGLSIFEATRVTFAGIIRKAYSFFNVVNGKRS